jgi:hypothetical protein
MIDGNGRSIDGDCDANATHGGLPREKKSERLKEFCELALA